ncbi:MAG: hypothetical protein EBY21_02005 [Alphaproteobacteria bacterium]|nr:hypothetical protein [Alphaproteobacteria bacterium]
MSVILVILAVFSSKPVSCQPEHDQGSSWDKFKVIVHASSQKIIFQMIDKIQSLVSINHI